MSDNYENFDPPPGEQQAPTGEAHDDSDYEGGSEEDTPGAGAFTEKEQADQDRDVRSQIEERATPGASPGWEHTVVSTTAQGEEIEVPAGLNEEAPISPQNPHPRALDSYLRPDEYNKDREESTQPREDTPQADLP